MNKKDIFRMNFMWKMWAIGQKVCVKTDITVDISIVMSV